MANSTALKFSDLSLSEAVLKAVTTSGYEIPTPIQAQIIPELLNGRDVLGVAQTGTGKTAAFALPILSTIATDQKKPQVLCLTPTRELAIQVAAAFKTYAQNIKGLKVLAVYGGTGYREQTAALSRGVQVIVGTPGRLMDLIDRKKLQLDNIQALVLDEADEMLRMGFIDDVEWILKRMPEIHQTALFSATMPPPIKKITKKYLNDPVEVMIETQGSTGENISQYFLPLSGRKLNLLHKVLETHETDAVIIFCRTKNGSNEVASFLQKQGYRADALNGDVAQDQREKIVAKLKRGDIDIVIATDVAARGLDVKRISLVINYDPPADTETYVHRIGRTGRAGRKGDAILFVEGRRMRLLDNIERITKQKINAFEFPALEVLDKRKLNKIFERIDAELQKDLSEYQSVIEQYLTKNPEVTADNLAAAMASIEAKSKPFFAKEEAPVPEFSRNKKQDRTRKGKRFQDNDSGGRSDKRRFERGSSPKSTVPTEGFLISVGEEHGVKKGDIVGAIANEAGIESKLMGKIQIFSKTSLIDLPKGMPDEVFQSLQNVRVRGQKIQIRRAGDNEPKSKVNNRSKTGKSFKGDKKSSKFKNSPFKNDKKPKQKKQKTQTKLKLTKSKISK